MLNLVGIKQPGSNTFRYIQINDAILAISEDRLKESGDIISPKQTKPQLHHDQETDKVLMVCHPAALRNVMKTLMEGTNCISYIKPTWGKSNQPTLMTEQEFSHFIK